MCKDETTNMMGLVSKSQILIIFRKIICSSKSLLFKRLFYAANTTRIFLMSMHNYIFNL